MTPYDKLLETVRKDPNGPTGVWAARMCEISHAFAQGMGEAIRKAA